MNIEARLKSAVRALMLLGLILGAACQNSGGGPTGGVNDPSLHEAAVASVAETPPQHSSPLSVKSEPPDGPRAVEDVSASTKIFHSPAATVPSFEPTLTRTQPETSQPLLPTLAVPEGTSASLPTLTPQPSPASEMVLATAPAPIGETEPSPTLAATSTANSVSQSAYPLQFTPTPPPVIGISFPDDATELHIAAVDAGAEVIREILDRGVEVNASVSITVTVEDTESVARDLTALHLAIWRNSDEVVTEMLLDYGANLDAIGWNRLPIHFAAQYRGPTLIELLLTRGADVNAPNDRSATPLHYAARHNADPEATRVLLKAGADISAGTAVTGHTPLHQAARNSNAEIARLLLEQGADVHARTERGLATPLHLAARYNANPAVIELLLDHGADINARGEARYEANFGPTPLHWAIRYNANPEVAGLLADRGADMEVIAELEFGRDTAPHYLTPSELALRKNDTSIAERLGLVGG